MLKPAIDKKGESSEEEYEASEEESSQKMLEEDLADESTLEENLRDEEFKPFSKTETLLKAIKIGDKPKIEQLLQNSPELLEETLSNGLKPLAIAINHNQEEIVRLLLERGASLKTGHSSHSDAEDYAQFWGKSHLAKLIQQHKQQSSKKTKSDMDEVLTYKSSLGYLGKSAEIGFSIVNASSNSNNNNFPAKPETQALIPMRTLGQGDCAFHAAFGHWDSNRGLFICKEVTALRKTVAEAIRSVQKGASFFKSIQEAIQQLLMSGREGGQEIKNLRKTYQYYLQANKKAIQAVWKRFEETLDKYPDVLAYVQNGVQTLVLEERARLTTLQRQFNRCLNLNEGELYGIILSVEELDTQFKAYQQETNKDFDLPQYLTPSVLEDYAALMEKPGYWLLPGELAIVAEALDTTLVLYITDGKTGLRKPIETYYPQGKSSIAIYFNGINHYERIIDKSKKPEPPKSNATTAQEPIQIETCFKQVQRVIEHAYQAYRFIGRSYEKHEPLPSHREFQDKLKDLLNELKKRLHLTEEILLNCKKNKSNAILVTQLREEWKTCEKDIQKKVASIQTDAEKLKPLLPEAQQQCLQMMLSEIINGFQSKGAMNKIELQCLLQRKLLKVDLLKLKSKIYPNVEGPSCFISYSWGDEANVRQVHRIARDLKRVGINVKLDIWDNTTGSIEAFTESIHEIDYVIVVGTPDLMEKWKNFTSSGASKGKTSSNYKGNVVAKELNKILSRLSDNPNENHGIVNLLLYGEPKESFPSDLVDLPSDSTDFRDKDRYIEAFINLLVKLPPKTEVELQVKLISHKNTLKQYKKRLIEKVERLQSWEEDELRSIYQKSEEVTKKSPQEIDAEILGDLGIKHSLVLSNKRVPKSFAVGNSDFKSTIEQNGLIIDKSLFIKEVIDDITQVKLIIRPRRFGKTFNMSMLKYFFDIQEKQGHLFHELKIWQEGETYQKEQGRYPVLFITFKDIKADNFEEAYEGFQELLSKLYKQYKPLLFDEILKQDEDERKAYQKIIDCETTKTATKQALKNLTEHLYKAYSKRIIILIDEYDTPINHGYLNKYYQEMTVFIRDLLSPLLKDNAYLQQAILTGILRVAKESIFSGLNNIVVYSVLDEAYSTYFGFSQREIECLLGSKSSSTLMNQIKEWYGGYQIGKCQMFNPWSIVNFITKNRDFSSARFDSYWINTSENKLIKRLLEKIEKDDKTEIKKLLRKLIAKKSITQVISEHTIFSEIDGNLEALWSFLLLQGYLTFNANSSFVKEERTQCELTIPNRELYGFYEKFDGSYLIFNIKLEKFRNTIQNNHDLQDELNLYIPLMGAHRLSDIRRFDLAQKMQQFIEGDQKVLLLLGEAGSGKSTFSRYLEYWLWKTYQEGKDRPIPLFISLPSSEAPAHNIIRTHLNQYHFTEEELNILQQHPLVLFLDGYDEMGRWINLYTANQLERWNVKVIFTCRTNYAHQRDNYATFFMPFQNAKPQINLYAEMMLVPFLPEQIKSYIKGYLKIQLEKKKEPTRRESEEFSLAEEDIWWKEETYHEYFGLVDSIKAIPNLLPILENPFNLNLAMKVMPQIVEQYAGEIDILKRRQMTKTALYDIFMSEWFIREENKLIQTATNPTYIDDIKPYYWEFCKALAVEMKKQDITQVTYIPSPPGLFGSQTPTSPWEKFFGKCAPTDIRTLVLRAAPIRNSGHQYAFIHPSLLEYFYSLAIYDEMKSKNVPFTNHLVEASLKSLEEDFEKLSFQIDSKENSNSLIFSTFNNNNAKVLTMDESITSEKTTIASLQSRDQEHKTFKDTNEQQVQKQRAKS